MERQSVASILGHAGRLPGPASLRWRFWLALNVAIAALVVAWITVRAGDESGTPPPSFSRPPAAVSADIEVVSAVSTAIETRIDLRVGAIGDERTLPIRVANLPRLVFADGTSILARGQDSGIDRVGLLFPGSAGRDARLELSLSREAGQLDAGQPGRTAVLDLPISIDAPYAAETARSAGLEVALGPGVAVIDRVVRDASGVEITGHFAGFSTEELQAMELIGSSLAVPGNELRVYSFRGGFGEKYERFELVFAGKDVPADATLMLRLGVLPAQPDRPTPARLRPGRSARPGSVAWLSPTDAATTLLGRLALWLALHSSLRPWRSGLSPAAASAKSSFAWTGPPRLRSRSTKPSNAPRRKWATTSFVRVTCPAATGPSTSTRSGSTTRSGTRANSAS